LRATAFILVAALLIGVGGCAGMSPSDNAKFRAVMATNVSVGMPFVTAIQHLTKAGFYCQPTTLGADAQCNRVKFSLLPFSCVQRVSIATDTHRDTVVSVTPEPIACVSL
jgi:hypothetical protein